MTCITPETFGRPTGCARETRASTGPARARVAELRHHRRGGHGGHDRPRGQGRDQRARGLSWFLPAAFFEREAVRTSHQTRQTFFWLSGFSVRPYGDMAYDRTTPCPVFGQSAAGSPSPCGRTCRDVGPCSSGGGRLALEVTNGRLVATWANVARRGRR